jgi:hypothetical protein
MGCVRSRFEAHQRSQQQAAHRCIFQRAFQQSVEQEIAAAEGAQGQIGEVHGRRAQWRGKPGTGQRDVEVAAGDDFRDQAGSGKQGVGKGR